MSYIDDLKLKANTNEYKDIIKAGVADNINDEITAMVLYYILAERLKGFGTEEAYEEIREHAKQEGCEHFVQLVEYSSIHGILDGIIPSFTPDLEKYADLTDNKEIIKAIQDLETKARQKYLALAKFAEENGDLETKAFFLEIAEDEADHFDDLAYINNDKRPFGESLLKGIIEKVIKK